MQDTRNIRELMPVPPRQVAAQARTLLADVRVAAIKIGLLGSVAAVETVRIVGARCIPGVSCYDHIDLAVAALFS